MEGTQGTVATYRFKLVLGGQETVGVFREATADLEGEVIDLAEPKRVRGTANKTGDITLQRGIDENKSLWKWNQRMIDKSVEGAGVDGQILLLDYDGSPIATYSLKQAWPSKYTGGALSAGSNDVAVESIVIAHEGLSIQ
jgi:phage tail-like protein